MLLGFFVASLFHGHPDFASEQQGVIRLWRIQSVLKIHFRWGLREFYKIDTEFYFFGSSLFFFKSLINTSINSSMI